MRLAAGRDFATKGEVHLLDSGGRSVAVGHLDVPDLPEPRVGDRLGLSYIIDRVLPAPSMADLDPEV